MEIKVCGMRESNNLNDLLKRVNPDWVGLIFFQKSPRFVEDSKAGFIEPIESKKVGVFVNEDLDHVLEKIEKFSLDVVQLHGSETVEYLEQLLEKSDVQIWKVFPVSDHVDWEIMIKYEGLVSRFLFDTASKKHGGTGRKFNWGLIKEYPFETPFMLSGGLDSTSVRDLASLARHCPKLVGVDLNSNFEKSPALKDVDELLKFKKELNELLAQKG